MYAVIMLLLFWGVQVSAAMLALLLTNWGELGDGHHLVEAHTTPINQGLALLICEGLLSVALWAWFYRFEPMMRRIKGNQPLQFKVCVDPRKVLARRVVFSILSMTLLAFGLSLVLEPFHLSDKGSTDAFRQMLGHPLCLLQLCLVGPLTEELVFRVGIVGSLRQRGMPAWLAVVSGALAFGVVHGNLSQAIPAFLLGLALGAFYLRTGNLWLCLSAHIVNNLFAVILLLHPEFLSFVESWPVVAVIALGLLHIALGLLNMRRAFK